MYYSSGTYESFAHPEKPEGVDKKSAYIIGTGLAGLSAAFYLVRDGQVKGERIHLLEKLDLAGGSCDGRKDFRKGFYMRGGREMDNHFECMWDLFRDVVAVSRGESGTHSPLGPAFEKVVRALRKKTGLASLENLRAELSDLTSQETQILTTAFRQVPGDFKMHADPFPPHAGYEPLSN